MDLDIFNHQIMYKLGGIEAQKNSSLESLQNVQSRIFEAMKRAQKCLKKIYEGIYAVKQNLQSLKENYLNLCNDKKHSGKLINKIQNEVNEMFEKMGEEALSISRKMQKKAELYLPNFKKLKQKYTDSADALEHYKQKIVILRKNIEKQSLANVTQDEHKRFERNKDKLKKAELQHDDVLLDVTKRYVDFNNEGIRDLYSDLLSFMSTIGSQMISGSTHITDYLYTSFSTAEIVLAREIQTKKKAKSQQKSHNLFDMEKHFPGSTKAEETQADSKKIWLHYLIEERQITSYMKTVMDQEMSKVEPVLSLQNFFHKKEPELKQSLPAKQFDGFKNLYNTPHLRHHAQTGISKVKQPDPINACEDLIEVEELSVNSPSSSILSVEENDNNEEHSEIRKKERKISVHEQKLKNNLQKFNRLCEQNKTSAQKPKLDHRLPTQVLKSNHQIIEKQQKTVNAGDFFSMYMTPPQKQEKSALINQQQLGKLHEGSKNQMEEVDFFHESTPKPSGTSHLNKLSPFQSETGAKNVSQTKKSLKAPTHIDLLDL